MTRLLTPKRLFLGAVTVFIAGLIIWGATADIPPIPKLFDQQDKLEHFGAFGALTLWMSAFLGPRNWIYAALIALCCAVGLEGVQAFFIPSREGDLPDLMASLAGVAASLGFIFYVRSLARSRRTGRSQPA